MYLISIDTTSHSVSNRKRPRVDSEGKHLISMYIAIQVCTVITCVYVAIAAYTASYSSYVQTVFGSTKRNCKDVTAQ